MFADTVKIKAIVTKNAVKGNLMKNLNRETNFVSKKLNLMVDFGS